MSEDAAYVLLKQVAGVRIRILRSEGEERPDASWQRLTCHVHRDDLPHAVFGLIFALGVFSFSDARPRGASEIEFRQEDDWTVADMLGHLRYERGLLDFDADYVRGRMMKTRATIHQNGRLVIDTTNRHEMATRWVRLLQGKKHLRLVTG